VSRIKTRDPSPAVINRGRRGTSQVKKKIKPLAVLESNLATVAMEFSGAGGKSIETNSKYQK